MNKFFEFYFQSFNLIIILKNIITNQNYKIIFILTVTDL
jgi:hypothetical protein